MKTVLRAVLTQGPVPKVSSSSESLKTELIPTARGNPPQRGQAGHEQLQPGGKQNAATTGTEANRLSRQGLQRPQYLGALREPVLQRGFGASPSAGKSEPAV